MMRIVSHGSFSNRSGRQGGMTVFLCIILAGLVLTESILWAGAGRRATEADLARCMRLQAAHSLSSYNSKILDYYGLYTADASSTDTTIFDTCFRSPGEAGILVEPTSPMTKEAIFKGIIKFMQIRMPAFFCSEILSRLLVIGELIEDSGVFSVMESQGSSEWLTYLSDFISKKEAWSQTIESAMTTFEDIDFTGTTKKIKTFFSTVRNLAERGGTSFLQGDSDVGEVLDFSNLVKVFDVIDAVYGSDLPEPVDDYFLNLYTISFLDSRIINQIDGTSSKPEENAFGKKYEELHPQNICDLEYVLTGFDNELISMGITQQLVGDVRLISNFAMNLLDKQKMEQSLLIARVIASCIAVLSAGTIEAPPEVIRYLVLYVWSIADSMGDVQKLIAGERVPLFRTEYITKNELLDDSLSTDYRDYVHVLLMLVPGDFKSDRILNVIKRDAGGELYAGIRITARYNNTSYVLEDAYDAYAVEEE